MTDKGRKLIKHSGSDQRDRMVQFYRNSRTDSLCEFPLRQNLFFGGIFGLKTGITGSSYSIPPTATNNPADVFTGMREVRPIADRLRRCIPASIRRPVGRPAGQAI